MIKENEKVTKESLEELNNSAVFVKLRNGRVISGFLREADGIYTIKLGVKHIVVDIENLAKVSRHP